MSIKVLGDESFDISDQFAAEADYDIDMHDFVVIKYALKEGIKYYLGPVDRIMIIDFITRDDSVIKLLFISGATERTSNFQSMVF